MDTCEDEEADLTRTARWRRFADEANLGSPPEGYYARLVKGAPAADRTAKQVEKDLHRTFGSLQRPGLRALRVPTPEAMKSLRNVLLAGSGVSGAALILHRDPPLFKEKRLLFSLRPDGNLQHVESKLFVS